MVCWAMIAALPAFLFAADSGGAMLYGKGTVWLNNSPLPHSSAIFSGDLIRTERQSVANFSVSETSVVIQTDSLVKFEGNAVSVEHGGVSVATSKGMVALAREVTVTPASNSWTEFEVVDADGTVEIVAGKGNVNVNCGTSTANLSEGEQATRDDSGNCNKKKKRKGLAGPPVAQGGGLLTDPYVLGGALVGGGVIICLLLCTAAKPFLSQWKP